LTHPSYKVYFGAEAELVFDVTTNTCSNGGGTYFEAWRNKYSVGYLCNRDAGTDTAGEVEVYTFA